MRNMHVSVCKLQGCVQFPGALPCCAPLLPKTPLPTSWDDASGNPPGPSICLFLVTQEQWQIHRVLKSWNTTTCSQLEHMNPSKLNTMAAKCFVPCPFHMTSVIPSMLGASADAARQRQQVKSTRPFGSV